MIGLNPREQTLMHHLNQMGTDKSAIPGLFWSLKSCLLVNPDINQIQINKRLERTGWPGFKLDDVTLKLAVECFKAPLV